MIAKTHALNICIKKSPILLANNVSFHASNALQYKHVLFILFMKKALLVMKITIFYIIIIVIHHALPKQLEFKEFVCNASLHASIVHKHKELAYPA